jgi:hypothetical protein
MGNDELLREIEEFFKAFQDPRTLLALFAFPFSTP